MQMIEESLYNLFSPSDKFFTRFLAGKVCGRKLKLWDYFRNYFFHYKHIATNIFEYEGLTKELANEIEKRLFYYGRCGIVKDGELWAVTANPYGQNRYGKPIGFNFAFLNGETLENGNKATIGENGVLALNNYDVIPTALIVEQYAFQLAHVDTSIVSELINSRILDVFVTHSNSDDENARRYLNNVYVGDLSFLTDKTEEIEINRQTRGTGNLKNYIDTKDRFMKDSYENFGIKKLAEKRERMITGEVETTKDLMNLNLKEMYDYRKKMCDDIKETFGINCSVISHVDLDGDMETNEEEFEGGVNNDGN